MHVEWKIVTGDPQVTRNNRICKNVLRMQRQPEACASDLDDGSHITCAVKMCLKIELLMISSRKSAIVIFQITQVAHRNVRAFD